VLAMLAATMCCQARAGGEVGRFSILDPIKTMGQVIHGKASLVWAELPQPILPTKDELKGQTSHQKYQRLAFWLYVMGLTYMITLGAGTLIMGMSAKLRAKPQDYQEILEDNDGPSQLSEWKSKVTVGCAFCFTYTTCTAAVWWSLTTDRLSKVSWVDWEVYWVLFSMNCLWLIAQAAYKVLAKPGTSYNWIAFAEATIAGTFPFFSDSFDTLRDAVFAGLFPITPICATRDRNIQLDVFGSRPHLSFAR